MIRAIRPNAMAQDDATLVGGWNLSPNLSYVLTLNPSETACGAMLHNEDMSVLVASGAALVGTDQPCVLHPHGEQAIGMVDADLGWHLLLTTDGTEGQRTIRIGPAVDLPDEIHPVYGEDDLAVARATAAIDAAAHYIDDVAVTCPLGLGADLGEVVSVPVDGVAVVGQVESVTWTGTPSGAPEQAVIRRHVAIAPPAYTPPPVPPTVADDTFTIRSNADPTGGNVLANDEAGLVVSAVKGVPSLVGVDVVGSEGGIFNIAADGSWAFDPNGDFDSLSHPDTIETEVNYAASDGVSESVARLVATVQAPPASYRYFRLKITKLVHAGTLCDVTTLARQGSVGELQLFDADDVQYPKEAMTSHTAPSPYVASASGEAYSTWAAWKAFDRNNSNTWASSMQTTPWVQVDVGDAAKFRLAYIKISQGEWADYYPVDFTVSGSNTGAFSGEEELLVDVVGASGWSVGTLKTFEAVE